MTALDWLILAVFGVSSLVGLLRGAAFELVSLGGWVAGFVVAHQWSGEFAARWLQGVQAPALRDGLAWGILFSLTLLLAGLLATLLRLLLRSTGLGLLDRGLGAVFGAARGLVLVLLALLVARYTSLPQSAAWRASILVPPAQSMADRLQPLLPQTVHQVLGTPAGRAVPVPSPTGDHEGGARPGASFMAAF